MIEYTVILAFGVMLALGPGDWILNETLGVLKENHRGYSWAMSMSPMPDYDTAHDYRDKLVGQNYRPETINRLAVDGAALNNQLGAITTPFATLVGGITAAYGIATGMAAAASAGITGGIAPTLAPAPPGLPLPIPTPIGVAIPPPPH